MFYKHSFVCSFNCQTAGSRSDKQIPKLAASLAFGDVVERWVSKDIQENTLKSVLVRTNFLDLSQPHICFTIDSI